MRPNGGDRIGAGQVVRLDDGSRIQRNKYDPAGNVISQTTTMKLHAWTPSTDQTRFTWATQWQYDGLGRLKTMVYPDSERLTYGYDAGGLVNLHAVTCQTGRNSAATDTGQGRGAGGRGQ